MPNGSLAETNRRLANACEEMEDPKPLALDEFLAWESEQEDAHELIDGAIVAMSGPTRRHALLVDRLRDALRGATRRDECDVYAGDMTVAIETTARHNAPRPDVVVTRDERDRRPDDLSEIVIRYPKLVVEVLSPATASVDLGPKVRSYFSIPTMREYLCVDSRERFIVLHRREADAIVESWPIGIVELTSVRASIAVESLYDGLFG